MGCIEDHLYANKDGNGIFLGDRHHQAYAE